MSYLFGFDGRVNRAKIWLFLLIAIMVECAVFAIAFFAFQWNGFVAALQAQGELHKDFVDWAALPWPALDGPKAWGGAAAIGLLFVVLIWASFAVTIKRLHDRNKSAWWLLLYWGLPVLVSLGQSCPYFKVEILKFASPGQFVWGYLALSLAVLVLDIWVFIDLYCLRGTDGANQYGADPLAKA